MAYSFFKIKKTTSTSSATTVDSNPNDSSSNFEYDGVWLWDGFPRRCQRCRMLKDRKCLKKKDPKTCRKLYKLK